METNQTQTTGSQLYLHKVHNEVEIKVFVYVGVCESVCACV